MKIVLTDDIVYGYASGDPAATGGAERFQWLLAHALAQAGWSVVVGVRERLSPGEERMISGVRFVGMPRGNFIPAWSSFLASEKPDWWYWQSADPLWGALLLIAKTKGVRAIFSAAFDRDVRPRIALTRRERWWPLYALGLNSVDRIFVQHAGQMAELSRRLQPKAEILPGVVSVPAKIKTYSQRGNYVAWTAVLREPKRPDLLIEMARKTPDLRYVVCGGTSRHRSPKGYGERIVEELRSLPNVDYRGHVDPHQILDIIAGANALLSTSDQEGFPSTFLEAWAAGTPVVSLKIDPGGVIRERGLGQLSGTTDKAAADLHALVNSHETFEAISRRARRYVEEVHSNGAVAKVFDKAILQVN